MQDQLKIPHELIRTFLENRKEGKKQLVEWILNHIMEEEASTQVSASRYERTDERKAHRNGSHKRKLNTTDGELTLNKPQIREFPFETKVFDRYSRVEKALESVILESYLMGVSKHSVRDVVRSLGMRTSLPPMFHHLHPSWMQMLNHSLTGP